MSRIVITGLGAITAIGNDVPTFWANLVKGVSGAGPITTFDASNHPVRIACEVKGFDPGAYMDPKMARRIARCTQFAIAVAKQALADANFEITADNAPRVGVIMNTGGGGITDVEEATLLLAEKGPRSISPFLVPSIMPNAVACLVSIETGAKGLAITSTAACASGNLAMNDAYYYLQRGELDLVIAGGTESVNSPLTIAAFGRMGPLSCRNDDPLHACRPFDAERDGFVSGEGAAAMVMETEEYARRRGAPRIYGTVLGGKVTADAYHITAPDPDGDGASRAMKGALENTGLKPDDIDVIYAHGTGTKLNDVSETKAIKKVFGDHAYKLAITATKSMIGHTMGAAGIISAVAAALTLSEGVIPPTINYSVPDPECDLDYVPNVARRQKVRNLLINSFGFGGQNVVTVLGAA
jgi:3-oxoacyl-[acyl-carrier-protein] synthase II